MKASSVFQTRYKNGLECVEGDGTGRPRTYRADKNEFKVPKMVHSDMMNCTFGLALGS
jgi:hypothetical protein